MKALLVSIAIIAGAWPAVAADDFVRKDNNGAGKTTIRPGPLEGTYGTYDRSGRRTGTIERNPLGDYVIRDNSGRRRGSIERRR